MYAMYTCTYTYACAAHACLGPMKVRRGHWILQTAVMDVYGPSCEGRELNSCPLQDQVLLMIEPTLQPNTYFSTQFKK